MKEINDSLLNKAIRNFNIAKMIYSDGEMADEMYLNNVGYNLEQAVELAIKHVMELSGCQYPKTHDIEQLIRIAEEEGVASTAIQEPSPNGRQAQDMSRIIWPLGAGSRPD